MSKLNQIVYVSKAAENFDEDQVLELLNTARASNQETGITGMLLFDGKVFLQVIEGQTARVDDLFTHIKRDSRHHDVVTLLHRPIATREFPPWSMGYSHFSEESLKSLTGANDFFGEALILSEVDPSRAKRILAAFAEGFWR